MKLLRVGDKGKEIPAIVDGENNYRDLSSLADDLKPSTLNFEILKKIKDSDISKLPIVSKDQRLGSCVNKPGKFIAIGLNYSDIAMETLMLKCQPIMEKTTGIKLTPANT